MDRSLRLIAGAALLLALTRRCPADAAENVALEPTGIEATARGKASFSSATSSGARFAVSVQRLTGDADYELMIDGVPVHTLHTNPGGRAKARFAGEPRNERTMLLSFDPVGKAIEVKAAGGDEVLAATLPGGTEDNIACCIPDDLGDRCEDRTAGDCEGLGGTVSTTASCDPDSCGAAPPVDADVVCCSPAESGQQCSIGPSAACAGDVVDATSCTPDPCAVPPPPTCSDNCWTSFFACLSGCTSTYCAPYCQYDLGRCVESCSP